MIVRAEVRDRMKIIDAYLSKLLEFDDKNITCSIL